VKVLRLHAAHDLRLHDEPSPDLSRRDGLKVVIEP
jgi:hypothetical protein